MRRILGAAAVAVLVGTMIPAQAEDASGTVLVPSTEASRVHRCQDVHGAPNGTFGYQVDVTPNKSFALTAVGGDDIDDFDIIFLKSMTGCASDADPVATAHENVAGDEAGTVPADASVAVITLYLGVPGAAFTYTES